MARQSGNICITGTIDQLCFYRMDDKFYVRLKSSLTGKRVKKDPAFRATMYYAGLLGQASKLASSVYRSLPEDAKKKGLFRQLTGKATQWLKEGYDGHQVILLLQETIMPKTTYKQEKTVPVELATDRYPFADAVIAGIPEKGPTHDTDFLLQRVCDPPP